MPLLSAWSRASLYTEGKHNYTGFMGADFKVFTLPIPPAVLMPYLRFNKKKEKFYFLKKKEKEKNVALGRTGARAGGWRKQIKG